MSACNNTTDSKLLILSNGVIEIGILPDVGAALVHASLCNMPNILNSDSTLWDENPEKRATLDPKVSFKAYNGHITWLSPQSEWWIKQDLFPDLKASAAAWPPDPILTLAPYQIISHSKNEIVLESQVSPYSKVQFTKTFKIDGNKVHISTIAKNTSKESVSWGLWHNTRMNGWDAVFVKADSTSLIKINYFNPNFAKPEMSFDDGFYSFQAEKPNDDQEIFKAKAFLNVSNPLIAGFHNNQWLIIRSKSIDNNKIHKHQKRVEIYIENSTNKVSDLQELEMQFEYTEIQPGQSIEAGESWEIIQGSGHTTKRELLNKLREKLADINSVSN